MKEVNMQTEVAKELADDYKKLARQLEHLDTELAPPKVQRSHAGFASTRSAVLDV